MAIMHKMSIPDYILQRVVARRGKISIYDRIEARSTALLVIDLQNAFLLKDMPSYVPAAIDMVPNINRLAKSLRVAGGTVVWIQHTYDPAWTVYSDFSKPDHLQSVQKAYAPGQLGHKLHNSLAVADGDLIIAKRRFSAFIQGSSDLDCRLRSMGINCVIVTGVVSNTCCESTARDAMMLNYKTLFVSDANGAMTDEEHNATLCNMLRAFADVVTTDEAISRLC